MSDSNTHLTTTSFHGVVSLPTTYFFDERRVRLDPSIVARTGFGSRSSVFKERQHTRPKSEVEVHHCGISPANLTPSCPSAGCTLTARFARCNAPRSSPLVGKTMVAGPHTPKRVFQPKSGSSRSESSDHGKRDRAGLDLREFDEGAQGADKTHLINGLCRELSNSFGADQVRQQRRDSRHVQAVAREQELRSARHVLWPRRCHSKEHHRRSRP